MSFDPVYVLLLLAASGAGYVLFSYGRKQARPPLIIGGVLLMIYPYVVSSILGLVLVGVLIGAATWFATRLGW